MNILLINHYAGSMRHGMEFRPYYLAREWVRAGHKVQVLSASFSHLRTSQPELDGLAVRNENIDGIDYRWYHTPAYQGNGIGRVLNMLGFLRAVRRDARQVARSFKPDVVIASSTYPMDVRPARRIAQLAGARLVYEVHDLWPLSPMELGGMSRWHPFIQWVQRAENYAYRHVDAVVSLLPKTLEYMKSRGMDAAKWHHVPNGVNEDEWNDVTSLPDEIKVSLRRLRDKGLPIVGYAGGHALSNALDTVLDAAKAMQAEASFVMVGAGAERERLLQRVHAEHIDNVVMLSSVPKSSVPAFLEQIDIAILSWKREKLYRFGVSPNKLMDYMMARKPVVMAIEAGNDPVGDANCGRTVPPEDPAAIRHAILELSALSPGERMAMGERGRAFVLAEHTYSVLARRFAEILANA